MKKTLYVLDAYGLIYRSYFAFINKPLTNKEGKNVSALFGFSESPRIFSQYNPECFVAAFDSPTPTFRHEMYDEYKATRQKTPEDLHAQIPVIEEILATLGVPLVRQDGFEADDIIASFAARCRDENRKCVILSGDKDLMQLVDDTVSMLKPGKTGGWELITPEGVEKTGGFPVAHAGLSVPYRRRKRQCTGNPRCGRQNGAQTPGTVRFARRILNMPQKFRSHG